ncbi:terminase large subunit domain-containing protein [Streptomyces sp. NRRL F-5135]|uniref:terminase large subunit domain-containing protein n=1 Tax=Streptomyces sp. NRRL F-5135 TaxID=1463858 RepID=UPI00099BF07A|nr:terminase family protein [Streptomyces sp. NRRL F-5135]
MKTPDPPLAQDAGQQPDVDIAAEAEEFLKLVAQYRRLNRAQRRRIAIAASPEIRTILAGVERDMALKRSPGSMSAILTDGKEKQARHLDLIDQVFRDIAAGRPRKVLITMPPRHGKSRRAARWAPLWYLSRHPDHRVMIASYSADLADDHGRWIRDAINTYGPQLGLALHAGSKAANRFDLADPDTGNRLDGGLVTAGVGGGLTGKGAHLAIVDDPIKDAADAESPTMRRRLWDWWTSVLNTRIEPGGSILVIQTRWHEQDLAGRILEGEDASDWTILDLPAIADSEDDALGRPVGEPLWPLRYGRKALEKIRRAVGERVWWSLYQQKPRPLEGGVWQWPWITDNRLTPMQFRGVDLTRIVVAVDTAGGDDDVNDETGLWAGGRDNTGQLYVLADRSDRMGADTWGHAACRLAIELRADAIVVESNFGGDMAKQIIRQAWKELTEAGETAGMLMPAIIEVHAKQGKRLRAEPIAQLYAQGLVHHVGEFPRLEGQLVTWIPGMDSPDRMDACVHGLTELADPASAAVQTAKYADHRLSGRR